MMDKDKPKKPEGIFLTIGSKQKKEFIGPEWKNGKKESAAAIEPKKEEEEFQWLFPEEGEQKADVIEQYATMQKTTAKRATGKLFIIVMSAVIVGVLLGYALVKVVTQKEEGRPQAILKEEKPVKEREVTTPKAAPSAKSEKNSLFSIETAVVQGGVFSTEDGANSMKQKMSDLGLPAEAVLQNGQYLILLAASSTIETAKLIEGIYGTAGADTYTKQLAISPSKKLEESSGEMAALFSSIAEESGKKAAGLEADKNKLKEAESKLDAVKVEPSDETSAELKKLLTGALTEAKSNQPQAAKAAQEKLLAFLAVYSQ
ncbi:hypothetical protein MKZ02_08850 [Pseudobacillus sp. FSL P4-0506]|uniref:hypothetical protein n=1 Tax=Pseudobacillus sp. FSL P4-0506 TaxID=2921576 RepID=UPI0030F707BD